MWSAVTIFIAVVFQSTTNAGPSPSLKYGIMLDAGSSGTRIKVYKCVLGRHNPLSPLDTRQVDVPKPDKVEPGLSTFGENINMIQGYLEQLIDSAKKIVPVELQPNTPILLFATAGMRLLPLDQQEAILNEVDRLFSDKSFCPFSYRSGWARVITGDEEAMYAWVTLNFLKGRFSFNRGTLGALDLGGASQQNAYQVSHVEEGEPTVTLSLAGKDYRLYVHSYLGYGLDEATESYFQHLTSGTSTSVVSPCHNKGYTESMKTDSRQITIIGDYDEVKCQTLLKSIFFCEGNVKQCPFLNQPELEGRRFFGIDAFYYVMKDLGVIQKHGEKVSFPTFVENTQQLCSLPSASLDPNLFDVKDLCFRGNYVHELFKDGYHMDFNSIILRISQKVRNFDLSWALGALLYEAKIL